MTLTNLVLGYLFFGTLGSFIFNLLLGHPGENWLRLRLVILGIILVPYIILAWFSNLDPQKRRVIYKWLLIVVIGGGALLFLLSLFNRRDVGGYGALALIFIGGPAFFLLFIGLAIFRYMHTVDQKKMFLFFLFSLLILVLFNILQLFTLAGIFE